MLEQVEDLFALYSGGPALNARVQRFIPKATVDPERLYAAKLHEAKSQFVGHFATIINYYQSYLFSHPMTIASRDGSEVAPYYLELKEDVDGTGRDLSELMKGAFREALIANTACVRILLPEVDQVPQTLAEYERAGAGDCALGLYGARDVLDYEFENQELEWVSLRKKASRRTPTSKPTIIETITILDREGHTDYVFHYKQGKQPTKSLEPVSVQRTEHGLGFVPAVLLCFGDQALGDKLEPPITGLWRARLKRAWLTNSHAHSMPVIHSDDQEIAGSMQKSGLLLQVGQNDKVDFFHPPAESFEALQNEIQDLQTELFRVANLSSIHEAASSKPWRSASAIVAEQDAGHVSVRSFGAMMRELLERVLNLIARIRQESILFSIGGFEHLESESLETLTKIAPQVLHVVHSKTFGAEFQKRIVSQSLLDLDEGKKQQIFAEIDAAKEAPPAPVAPAIEAEAPLDGDTDSAESEITTDQ